MALIAGLFCTAFSVCLLLKSGLGVSVISSVSISLYHSAPSLSFGIWNIIFQIAMLLLLIILLKKVKLNYIVSLGVGIIFGVLLDILKPIVFSFPDGTWMVPVYLISSLIIISIGISFFMKCQLPLMPCDIFIRELVLERHLPLGRMKTIFDVSCLIFSVAVSLIFTAQVRDIGIGTVISAVITGTLVSLFSKAVSKVFYFEPMLGITKRTIYMPDRSSDITSSSEDQQGI